MIEGQDYGGIRGIVAEAVAIESELKLPRAGCPKCSLTLQVNSAGWFDCPMGHYSSATQPIRGDA